MHESRQRRAIMRKRAFNFLLFIWGGLVLLCPAGFSQEDINAPGSRENMNAPASTAPATLNLYRAVMCEDIFENTPRNETVVFSVAKEKALCFTVFDSVPEKIFIYHNWYYKDIPSARIRLALQPPRWSTYSSIQIRKTDIGPWRVEIVDEKGQLLRVLRFSITD